ncbi:Tat (twin-arginine translocation) pathway signal sequence domain protein [Haloferax volcanii DS2]|uniref:Tat (Twin-arginine translocation) pathway signal sequence domain protein n=1 Tax=Haloferax volcanii (strain ATCC 29605 / DSM 3757 / JCM 8879 / NBRC 14742 / NCIMB 2012 / VKM B-1768 / DS2) TaxID=309800 RepID=L9V551_HALVD|nr:Tat (twin-arginine translocation) pathway signal sequence domain protein [Haloferax volcanii DS2]
MKKPNRRQFLGIAGTAIGVSSTTGIVSAQKHGSEKSSDSSIDPAPIELEDKKHAVIDDTVYSFARAKNTETGEVSELVATVKKENAKATQSQMSAESGVEMSVESVKVYGTKTDTVEKTNTIGVQNFEEKSAWDDLIEEVSDGVAKTISRFSVYKGDQNQSCNVYSGYGRHQIVGASVEYYDDINTLTKVAIGGLIGTASGLIAGSFSGVGAIATAFGGAVVGALAGYAWDHLKDSNILTFGAYDFDLCGAGHCAPQMIIFGSGTWTTMDKGKMYQVDVDAGNHVLALDTI